ncbi:hypothetical protein HDU96_000463 [Phlyctochytrium bullatum]|nr:hypothetical protein HDU96_000463 [Phlyctochytrium bullatum]
MHSNIPAHRDGRDPGSDADESDPEAFVDASPHPDRLTARVPMAPEPDAASADEDGYLQKSPILGADAPAAAQVPGVGEALTRPTTSSTPVEAPGVTARSESAGRGSDQRPQGPSSATGRRRTPRSPRWKRRRVADPCVDAAGARPSSNQRPAPEPQNPVLPEENGQNAVFRPELSDAALHQRLPPAPMARAPLPRIYVDKVRLAEHLRSPRPAGDVSQLHLRELLALAECALPNGVRFDGGERVLYGGKFQGVRLRGVRVDTWGALPASDPDIYVEGACGPYTYPTTLVRNAAGRPTGVASPRTLAVRIFNLPRDEGEREMYRALACGGISSLARATVHFSTHEQSGTTTAVITLDADLDRPPADLWRPLAEGFIDSGMEAVYPIGYGYDYLEDWLRRMHTRLAMLCPAALFDTRVLRLPPQPLGAMKAAVLRAGGAGIVCLPDTRVINLRPANYVRVMALHPQTWGRDTIKAFRQDISAAGVRVVDPFTVQNWPDWRCGHCDAPKHPRGCPEPPNAELIKWRYLQAASDPRRAGDLAADEWGDLRAWLLARHREGRPVCHHPVGSPEEYALIAAAAQRLPLPDSVSRRTAEEWAHFKARISLPRPTGAGDRAALGPHPRAPSGSTARAQEAADPPMEDAAPVRLRAEGSFAALGTELERQMAPAWAAFTEMGSSITRVVQACTQVRSDVATVGEAVIRLVGDCHSQLSGRLDRIESVLERLDTAFRPREPVVHLRRERPSYSLGTLRAPELPGADREARPVEAGRTPARTDSREPSDLDPTDVDSAPASSPALAPAEDPPPASLRRDQGAAGEGGHGSRGEAIRGVTSGGEHVALRAGRHGTPSPPETRPAKPAQRSRPSPATRTTPPPRNTTTRSQAARDGVVVPSIQDQAAAQRASVERLSKRTPRPAVGSPKEGAGQGQ